MKGSLVKLVLALASLAVGLGVRHSVGAQAQVADHAYIRVLVPDPTATVFFDGAPTKQSGPERLFHTPTLTPGSKFTYQIRVTWPGAKGSLSEERTVTVTAGETVVVDFRKPEPQAKKPAAGQSDRRLVGYFPEWGIHQRKYQVKDIPIDKLTHVNYAFGRIIAGVVLPRNEVDAIGDPPGSGTFGQLHGLKFKHPQLKTLLSIGGPNLSGPFSDVALTPKSREKFAASCVDMIRRYGFDGIDIDWEYPVTGGKNLTSSRPEDKQNFPLLLAEIREQLSLANASRTQYLLTVAIPGSPDLLPNYELDKIAPHVDWINLMAYNYFGQPSKLTNLRAPLFAPSDDPVKRPAHNIDATVKAVLKAGVPAQKIVLGVSFIGRGWGEVKNANQGLYQTHGPAPKGTSSPGEFDYRDIAANYLGKFERHWHKEAKAPWLYDAKSGLMISYEDPESLRHKAAYANEQNLGGMMCWELSADDQKHTLVNTLHETLRGKR